MKSRIKDRKLAAQGRRNIAWAERQMAGLIEIRRRFAKEKPLQRTAVGIALHVTKETAALVRTLKAGGAEVAIASCNPLSTQDDAAAALASEDVSVFAWRGETKAAYYENLERVIAFLAKQARERASRHLVTIDDGADLVFRIHDRHRALIPKILGGSEETTTGLLRLRAMARDRALRYPIIATNEAKTKHLMDNVVGTGQSAIDGILRATNVLLAGKTFLVLGFGDVGRGIAARARGMAARVIVSEVDPFRALQAHVEGYEVAPLSQAIKEADLIVTATGNRAVVRLEHLRSAKDGAIFANAGHFDVEIDVAGLRKAAVKVEKVRPNLEAYTIKDGRGRTKTVFLLACGRLVNLAAAEGHPAAIMSLSFSNQALAIRYLVEEGASLQPGVYPFPATLDSEVARIHLRAWGISIDSLTEEQRRYLASWSEGT